ncbi:MAG: hypothetical protein HKL95_00875 [Phycisphaerae bacterium]|nr:hypothetical protein [Phycisphaerae bacterium]
MLKLFNVPLLLIAVCSIAARWSTTVVRAASATPVVVIPATKNSSAPRTTHVVTGTAMTPPATNSAKPAVSAPVPTPADIQRWIHALASDEYGIRHPAARKLLAAGDAAIPAMKKALGGLTTPEMRHLLRQDISKIANLDFLRGPLITINARNISAQKVFQDICKQAGTTANVIQQGILPNVTIHATKAPFWQVMQQMAVLTNISPVPWYNQGSGLQLGLNGALNRGSIMSIQGGFVIVAQSISRTIMLNQPNPAAGNNMFNLSMVLLTIPGKTGPLQMQNADVTKAVDNHGNSLLGPAQPMFIQNGWFPNQPMSVYNFTLSLQWPHKPGKRITTLKGYLPILAAYHKKMLTLKIKAQGTVHQTLHGVRISVGHLQKVNGLWQFTLAIKLPAAEAAANNPTSTQQAIVNQIQNFNGDIFSSTGTVLNPNGWSSMGGWQQGMVYTIPIQMGAKPARITLPVFTRARALKIPFDLKNIPMP